MCKKFYEPQRLKNSEDLTSGETRKHVFLFFTKFLTLKKSNFVYCDPVCHSVNALRQNQFSMKTLATT